jgi:hypothetical protein
MIPQLIAAQKSKNQYCAAKNPKRVCFPQEKQAPKT